MSEKITCLSKHFLQHRVLLSELDSLADFSKTKNGSADCGHKYIDRGLSWLEPWTLELLVYLVANSNILETAAPALVHQIKEPRCREW
ncbi:hypothetical protein KQX54_019666 [Cotesia glomerata]|uniref:Uncharacterized protein n=1 Tax=Cotesia glomerata TaxID=32391 RepID=A0AAV7IFP1_COTGL|nr:hypothetical protein KQX54_019666 [Cotesia glomerata]